MSTERRRGGRAAGGPPRVLIIVQNLPVPFDRRVWLECGALVDAGYRVCVVCPKGPGDPAYAVVDGVELYKYRPYTLGGGKAGFVAEYLYSFLATAWLTWKARRHGRFAAVQACNPPDIFWPLARVLRRRDGSAFVFDHHDLCPELYQSRFPDGPALPYRALRALERRTHRSADRVIATNDSYRQVAIERSGTDPAAVTVVRTGPDPQRLRRGPAEEGLRRGRRYLVAYIGVMGPQDGVDIVVRAAAHLVHERGRRDIAFTLIGSGDCFDELVALRDELGLAGDVEFTGRIPDEQVARIMSSADVGLSPDPLNPLNDVSTMNKTMEYMAFGLPVVAFDLRETRVSAGAAAVYVAPGGSNGAGADGSRSDGGPPGAAGQGGAGRGGGGQDRREAVVRYAAAIADLLADEPGRQRMGAFGRDRVEHELAWTHQRRAYLRVYAGLVGDGGAATGRVGANGRASATSGTS